MEYCERSQTRNLSLHAHPRVQIRRIVQSGLRTSLDPTIARIEEREFPQVQKLGSRRLCGESHFVSGPNSFQNAHNAAQPIGRNSA